MVARLALVIHCGKVASGEVSNARELSPVTMRQAIDLEQYFLANMLRLAPAFDAGMTKQEKLRKRILAHIKRHRDTIRLGGGKLDWTPFRHAMRRSLTNESGYIDDRLLEQVLDVLKITGHIKVIPRVDAAGKPLKPEISVNPWLLYGLQ